MFFATRFVVTFWPDGRISPRSSTHCYGQPVLIFQRKIPWLPAFQATTCKAFHSFTYRGRKPITVFSPERSTLGSIKPAQQSHGLQLWSPLFGFSSQREITRQTGWELLIIREKKESINDRDWRLNCADCCEGLKASIDQKSPVNIFFKHSHKH